MKKIITTALAALTVAGAAAATATPAAAAPWGHGGYYHGGGYRGWGPGAAVGAGLLGFAVGAAIADQPHGYGYGPYGCPVVTRWNPYWGGYQRVRACY
jgi:hypothetical protein